MSASIFASTGERIDRRGIDQEGSIHPSSYIWFAAPAAKWNEALPVDNGRLGAMLFGGVAEERLQLNEDTYWTGGPYSTFVNGGRKVLPEIQWTGGPGERENSGAMDRWLCYPCSPDSVGTPFPTGGKFSWVLRTRVLEGYRQMEVGVWGLTTLRGAPRLGFLEELVGTDHKIIDPWHPTSHPGNPSV